MNQDVKNELAKKRKLEYHFSNDENYEVECKICGLKCKSWCNFGKHLNVKHNLSTEEYYKIFYKTEKEGICAECGKSTKFNSILFGYFKFCCKKCSTNNAETRKHCEETNVKKLGVKYTIQNKECRKKLETTNIEKYGVSWNMSNETIRNKAKKTKKDKYGDENYNNREQAIQTWNDRSEEFKNEVKENRKKTCIKNYGCKTNLLTQECIKARENSCFKKFGVKHISQTDYWIEKCKETCILKYGVENYSLTSEFNKIRHKKYMLDNIKFDSSWEVAYYIFLRDFKIDFEYQPDIKFEYYVKDKKHYYFPDFRVENRIVEIKGNHLLKYQNELSDKKEKIEFILNSGIYLLTYDEIKPYLNYVRLNYGENYLRDLRI